MLYQIYDLHQAVNTPLTVAAHLTRATFQNPMIPVAYTRSGRAIAAAAELFERATRRFPKPLFDLPTTTIDGETVPVVETAVLERPFCTLQRFERLTDRQDPTVLVVAPMSGHYATLLRGTVEALLPNHDVYITDWRDASEVPLTAGDFNLDTYIDYLLGFMRHLGPNLHVIAVCQPAVPVLAAVSLLAQADDPKKPATMTLMGGPIDTGAAPTAVTEFAERRSLAWFEKSVTAAVPWYRPGGMRRVYPGFLQLGGFMSMNLHRHVGAHMRYFQHLIQGDGDSAEGHRKFYDEYLAVMDLTAEFYLDTVDKVFQKRALANGTYTWRGVTVDPGAITETALMTVEGELDDISAPGQTIAAHSLCRNLPNDRQQDYIQTGVGHYGIFNGRRWREQIEPRIASFIRRFEG